MEERRGPHSAGESAGPGWAGTPAGRVIVVLGAPVQRDGKPSPALRRRARWAAALYRCAPDAWLLASGGAVKGPVSEASVIAALLRRDGVPAARIHLEERSRNTWENARFCARILHAHGIPRPLLVTDPLHLPRARLAFLAFGLRVDACPVCRVGGERGAAALGRELLHEALGTGFYLLRMLVRLIGARFGVLKGWRGRARDGR